jgi:hypothetical protein
VTLGARASPPAQRAPARSESLAVRLTPDMMNDMRTSFTISSTIILAIAIGVSFSACRRASSSDNETRDTSTYRPEATPATQFERDLKYVRDGHFAYVWVFSRKDGKELTKEDSDALRTNAPKVVDWVTTDGNKKVIGGSNFQIEAPQMAALQKRFKIEDYSSK